jgi:hypothetical protein
MATASSSSTTLEFSPRSYNVGGIDLNVWGMDRLSPDRKVAAMFFIHGRRSSKENLESMYNRLAFDDGPLLIHYPRASPQNSKHPRMSTKTAPRQIKEFDHHNLGCTVSWLHPFPRNVLKPS